MMRRFSQRVRGIFLACTLAVLCGASARAQISPGPLAAPHRELEGTANCTRCHAVKAGSPDYRCLDCHREIALRVQQRHGYHATVVPPGAPTNNCVKCHSDHNGENFLMVHWDPRAFDHTKTDYPLRGKHAGLACAKCHNSEHVVMAERTTIKVRNLNRTYLGLSRQCTTCHEDKHKGQLGDNCARCHNETSWKVNKEFDHSKTKYPLTGLHADVACAKCHTPGPTGAVRYTGLKFDRCADCHNDVHKGAFKETCETCHRTTGWKRTLTLNKFDHSTTKYPLVDKHAEVACETCHHGADFKKAIAFKLCTDCHKADTHGTQFLKRSDRGACDACHNLKSFKPSTFRVPEHNKSDYPLRDKHADVACEKCHKPAGKATLYKVAFDKCTACHKDVHNNQFAGAPHLNRCEDCHDEKSFHRNPVTLNKHQELRFKLTGGHVAVACIDCHKPAAEKGPVQWTFPDLSCTTCHQDPHRDQFAKLMRTASAGQSAGCTACHNTEAWKKLSGFKHEATDFPLDGSHRGVACIECHKPPNMERTLKNVDYKAAPKACEQCHENVHAQQFLRTGETSTRCADCHNTNKWRPSTFNHEKTIFSLKGPHEQTRCRACHMLVVEVAGKPVLMYKPVPTACSSCHAGDPKIKAPATQTLKRNAALVASGLQ